MQSCRTSSTRCPLQLGRRVATQGYEPIDRSRTHSSTYFFFFLLCRTKLLPKLFNINTVQTTIRMPCCRSMMLRPCQAAGYQCPGPCVLRCEWDVKKRSSVSHQHRSAMINERRAEPILSTSIVPFPCPCLLFSYCQTVAQQPSLSSKTTDCGQDSHPWQNRLPHLRTNCRPAALLMFSRPLT